jgi:peptidoglycan/xylan/chitin deacetylase (PgdA/CDA1 family)
MRPYTVSPEALAAQLDTVVAANYQSVTFDQMRAGHRPDRGVVLTFDDGYRSFLTGAAPMLEERGMRAVVFVVAGSMGGVNTWDKRTRNLELLDSDEVAEAARRGHEVAAHAWRHVRLPQLSKGRLELELVATRALLEHVSAGPVRSFGYPYGAADASVVDVVARCGFDLACLASDSPIRALPPPLALPRAYVGPDTGPGQLLKVLANHAVDTTPISTQACDPFHRLVELTLGAAENHPPRARCSAASSAAGPLTDLLRDRGIRHTDEVLAWLTVEGRSAGRSWWPRRWGRALRNPSEEGDDA